MSLRDDMQARGYRPVAEIAKQVGVTRDTVRRWVRAGKVKSERLGDGGRDTPSIYVEVESVVQHLGEAFRRWLIPTRDKPGRCPLCGASKSDA